MTEIVGTIKELWRYPVKSMVGESVGSVQIESYGVVGDRLWAVRDDKVGEITGVRKKPKLLTCSATYCEEPVGDLNGKDVPAIDVTMPSGEVLNSNEGELDAALANLLGTPVSLHPLQPKSNWKYYRIAAVVGAKEMKRQFASKELPDMSSFSWSQLGELMLFVTPLGRHYDVYPLHLLTTNSLKKMAEIEPEGDFNTRRFRPNIVIKSPAGEVGFDEFTWLGGTLSIGDTVIKCETRTVRCSAPAQPQVDMAKSAKVVKALSQHTGRNMGINATVIEGGNIRLGDEVRWTPANKSGLAEAVTGIGAKVKNSIIHTMMKGVDLVSK
jgi:uncharacterized protein YcbX